MSFLVRPLGFGSDLVTRSGEVCAFSGLIRDALKGFRDPYQVYRQFIGCR
jgi:hypothetical protein